MKVRKRSSNVRGQTKAGIRGNSSRVDSVGSKTSTTHQVEEIRVRVHCPPETRKIAVSALSFKRIGTSSEMKGGKY